MEEKGIWMTDNYNYESRKLSTTRTLPCCYLLVSPNDTSCCILPVPWTTVSRDCLLEVCNSGGHSHASYSLLPCLHEVSGSLKQQHCVLSLIGGCCSDKSIYRRHTTAGHIAMTSTGKTTCLHTLGSICCADCLHAAWKCMELLTM